MSTRHPVLLRGVDKSRKSTNSATAGPCAHAGRPITCEQPASNSPAVSYPPVLPDLFAGCSPDVMTRAKRVLDQAQGMDRALLDGWRKVGREDARRPARPDWKRAAGTTMSPLGIACLLEYARAYEDERTAMRAKLPT